MSLKSLIAGAAIAATLAAVTTANGMDAEPAAANPLLAPWTGPYGGVPPFDRVQVDHLKPALETAMAEKLGEIDQANELRKQLEELRKVVGD